jgi:hypothetical protein
MKKKGVFFVLLLLLVFLVLSAFTVRAANETNADVKAYACLENKVKDQCSTLSTEEKIFSLLTIERCKAELLSDSLAEECWPDVGCKIKTTAQAILALRHVNADTTAAENWLLSQQGNFADIDWFLETEAEGKTSCTVTYLGNSYSFTINEDKTLSGSSGSCLRVDSNYWLKISPTCYDYEFKISCSNSFLTSLLYKKKTSTTVYVSEETHSASGEGTTTEKVSSSCFKEGSSCNYEGSLWAAVVLKSRGYDVSSYIPYLVAMADDNEKYLPESFLYSLTNDFRVDLLAKQQESKWWLVSGDKFYDTAVALIPFQNEQLTEKSDSKTWLTEVQGEDGCWQGNIRDTAILLYSLWPKKAANVSTAKDCESSGYACMSSASCSDVEGNILTDYTGCFGTNICCSKKQQLKTCSEQNGELCDSDEQCLGGSSVSASDTTGGRICCIRGVCGVQEKSECELKGGYCKSICSSGEEFVSYSCTSGNCCMIKQKSNLWIVIVLAILIILVVIGIIFRKKLREFFFKLKSKFGKGKEKGRPTTGGPRFPPSSQRVYPVQRRILPQQPRAPVRRPVPQKKSEFDDVLKKLKEIGK